MPNIRSIVLVLSGALVVQTIAVPAKAADFSRLGDALDQFIGPAMDSAGTVGLSIAVVDPHGVVVGKGYGLADKARNIPATPDTLYHVGGISALLTATDIMRRSERGELRLDDPLAAHLAGFAIRSRFAHAKPITIRALLAHHSGLPGRRLQGANEPVSLRVLQEQLGSDYLAEAPQTRFKESLIGYSLLGRLIEVKSGRDFADAVDTDLLRPLGMSRSTFGRGPAVAGVAKPYAASKEIEAVETRDRPAMSLIASANELAQFVRFVLDDGRTAAAQPLLRPATLRSMFEPQFPGLPLDVGHTYGVGWHIEGIKVAGAGPVSWHNGYYPGYVGHIAVAREQQLGVIVLSNDQTAASLVSEVGRKALELALAAKLQRPVAEVPPPATASPVAYSDVELAEQTGDYVVFGQPVHVTAAGGRLSADAFGRRVDLIPVARDTFMPRVEVLGAVDVFRLFDRALPGVSLRIVSANGRRFAVLEGLPQSPDALAFERIERRPVPAAWRARLGRYSCDNPDRTIELSDPRLEIDNGLLIFSARIASRPLAQASQDVRLAVTALTDDEAVVVGVGAGEGGTVKAVDRDGRVTLVYSGWSFTREK